MGLNKSIKKNHNKKIKETKSRNKKVYKNLSRYAENEILSYEFDAKKNT